jgi:hypothetical protein
MASARRCWPGRQGPRRSTPWVNLVGGGWPDQFFAGGWINDAGLDIDRVELRFANGVTLHDDSSEGVALFITDENVAMPGTVPPIDRAGNQIATHRPFPGPRIRLERRSPTNATPFCRQPRRSPAPRDPGSGRSCGPTLTSAFTNYVQRSFGRQ